MSVIHKHISQMLTLTYFSGKVLEVSNLQHRKIIKLHPGLVAQGFGVAELRGYFIEISLVYWGKKHKTNHSKSQLRSWSRSLSEAGGDSWAVCHVIKQTFQHRVERRWNFFPGPPQEPKLTLSLGFAWPCCARHDNPPQCYRARSRI